MAPFATAFQQNMMMTITTTIIFIIIIIIYHCVFVLQCAPRPVRMVGAALPPTPAPALKDGLDPYVNSQVGLQTYRLKCSRASLGSDVFV